MKKTLIASAIAAASVASFAQAAEMNMPTFYGNVQLAWVHTGVDEGDSSTTGLIDNGTTLGVKHSHEISPGVTGFMKIELEGIKADDKDNRGDRAGATELDEAYIGVKSDSFGQIWVGSDDSQYESLIDTIAQYYEYADLNTGVSYTTGEGDLVQYVSPSFGGLTVHAAVQVNGDGDPEGKTYPWQLGLKYEVDALSVAFAVDSNDGAQDTNNENSYGLRAGYTMGDLELSALYSMQAGESINGTVVNAGAQEYGLMAIYSMGANTFAASYEYAEPDEGDAEASVITLQALHNLSDNMYVWVETYFRNDDSGVPNTDDVDTTDLALGGVYYF